MIQRVRDILLLLSLLLLATNLGHSEVPQSRIDRYLAEVVLLLPEQTREALDRIPDFERRLLAAATYLRRVEEIESGWSWSAAEISEFRQTEEFREMVGQIQEVQREFRRRNPGYSLAVNIGARSLESQLAKWNRVRSVARPARILLDTLSLEMDDTVRFPDRPDSVGISRFLAILRHWEPTVETVPTVAVPGLSKHGQLKAFDFKVYRGGRLIAGAVSRTIPSRWERPGWTAELVQIVREVAPMLDGPLQAPYEPWHYEFDNTRAVITVATLHQIEPEGVYQRYHFPTPTRIDLINPSDTCETGIEARRSASES